jgi:nucleotide-binding universal stress UspA family protein
MSVGGPILATTDFSDPSMTAVHEAVELGRRLGVPILLVYVVEDRVPPMIAAVSSESEETIVARHVETAKRHIEEWVGQQIPGGDVETRVVVGSPHVAIVALAREVDATMIVIGRRGHGLLGHTLLGSTTARVVTEADCPVLVVRREG